MSEKLTLSLDEDGNLRIETEPYSLAGPHVLGLLHTAEAIVRANLINRFIASQKKIDDGTTA